MIKKILLPLIIMLALVNCNNQHTNTEIDLAKLLNSMSVEEKAGQMTQLTIEMISAYQGDILVEPHQLDTNKLRQVIVNLGVGSILNVAGHTYELEHWKEIITAIVKYQNQSRLKIPVLYGIDAIHGANYTVGSTLYPQQIALAATFNPQLVNQMANNVSKEVINSGIFWNFSPVLDVGRNPNWPRFWETFGEDPYLVSELGMATVKGYQEDAQGNLQLAACLKHYVGYSDPKTGNDRTPAYIPERQLQEIYLPPFEKCIKAGAKTIMVNSGEINGEPVHASQYLLQKVLRNQLNFKGVAVTDWEDIKNLYTRHKVAANYKEAIALAINAGIDLAMVPLDTLFTSLLIENIKEGNIKITRVNEAVLRILNLKKELGLFNSEQKIQNSFKPVDESTYKEFNYQLAAKCITLLKNNNALPLTGSESILVTGPNSNYINALNGGWTHTWQGRDTSFNNKNTLTILKALQNNFGVSNTKYLYGNTYNSRLSETALINAAANVNTVILCLGEDTYTEKPGDIHQLDLELAQQELISIYKKAGKKVIVVFTQGRPRTFASVEPMCDAVVYAYLPGNEGARAIADVITGKINPSGKLPFTYPRYAQTHKTYDCKFTETLDNNFNTTGFNPLYQFGHGLSYTNFLYSNLSFNKKEFNLTDTISLNVKISNTGNYAGTETVLVYTADEYASITPAIKKLRAFKQIDLQQNSSGTLQFKIAVKDLSFVGLNNKFIVEPGKFFVQVGPIKDSITIVK